MRTLAPIYGHVNPMNTKESESGETETSLLLKGKDVVFHSIIHLD